NQPALGGYPGMFSSSLRDTGGTLLTPQQMLFLRSALAAVNTLDLRDSDDDVTSRTFVLTDYDSSNAARPGRPKYLVTVFGAERQPFMTEVYARNDPDPANAYVAIELFNPYPVPIRLTNWRLATVSRKPTGIFNWDEAP